MGVGQIDVRWSWQLCCFLLVCCTSILPITDGQIVCRERLHEARIYRSAPTGTYVMTVRANDEFGSTHIIYRLGAGNETFHLDEKTGRLTTATAIHRDVGDAYNLMVMAMSGSIAQPCNIVVRVTKQNRHPPTFGQSVYRADIPYNQRPGTKILTVKATDRSLEGYNKEVYYFLRDETKEDHGQISTTSPSISNTVVDEWMYSELDSDSQVHQSINKYLAIDRRSGDVYLKQQLDDSVGRITAKVLGVDGGSPPMRNTTTVEVNVKLIGAPLNVTVDNITETGARACWFPPPVGQVRGFVVQFQTLNDPRIQNQSTVGLQRSLRPSCAYLGELQPATDYELWVFGYDDKMAGLNSNKVLFNTLTPRCPADIYCGNGTCNPVVSVTSNSTGLNFVCECQYGFYGDNCQYFNSCSLDPCLNEGSCINVSDNRYRCECVNGFYDDNCSSFNPCAYPHAAYCNNSGSCVSLFSHTYECLCRPGYYGQHCEKVDPCVFDNRCLNRGICRNISDNQTVCDCPPAFTGIYCENTTNPCNPTLCMNGGSCFINGTQFHCSCPHGFIGPICENVVATIPTLCANDPCVNGGSCTDNMGFVTCNCTPEFTGPFCETAVGTAPVLCDTDFCQNGATCIDSLGSVTCVCPPGYIGVDCGVRCTCVNGGQCVGSDDHVWCDCPPDFRGINCELTSLCAADRINSSKGMFNFDKTGNHTWVEWPCPYGPPDATASRQCTFENDDENSTWTEFDDSDCYSLEQFENQFSSSFNDSLAASRSFAIISDLMDADDSDDQASERLIKMIENFVSNANFDEPINITTKNLYVEVRKLSIDRKASGENNRNDVTFTGLSPRDPSKNCSVQQQMDGSSIDDRPTLSLSAQALSTFAKDHNTTDIQLNLVSHRSAALFRERNSDAKLEKQFYAGRPVFTVSLANYKVTNLTNVVKYKVKKPKSGTWYCVYWLVDESRWSTQRMTPLGEDNYSLTCSSDHMTSFSILFDPTPEEGDTPIAMSIISYIGSGLSVLGLILTILTFALFRCLNRERSGKILLNLCVSMLLLNVSFLSGAFKSDTLKKSGQVIRHTSDDGQADDTAAVSAAQRDPVCTAVAVFTHYFLLTTLSWMTVEAINMYQLLIYVFASTESRFLLKRCFVAWGAPAVIVGVTAAVDSAYYNPTNQYCMLSAVDPYVYYFTLFGPCCTLLLVNVIVFVMVTKVLFQPRKASGRIPAKISSNGKEKSSEDGVTWAQVRGAFTVMTLLGITWVFGAFAVSGPARGVFQYVFCVLNSLQGFLLFVVRCLQYPEARSAWLMLFRTGTLKRHRGPAKTSTTNSNNTHAKLALRITSSSASSTANTANYQLSSTTTTLSLDRRHNQSTRATSSVKRTDPPSAGGGIIDSNWVYGSDQSDTKANADSQETKEGKFTNWEYITLQQKRDASSAEDENKGFKSVWMVPQTAPIQRSAVLRAAEDAPFIEEDEKGVEERDLRLETVVKRNGHAGPLIDLGYSSVEHSPLSKRQS